MARKIYGRKAITEYLDVTETAVSNWIHRYRNTPAHQYETPEGARYWSEASLPRWREWYDQADWQWRKKPPTAEGRQPKTHYFPSKK